MLDYGRLRGKGFPLKQNRWSSCSSKPKEIEIEATKIKTDMMEIPTSIR